VLKYPVSPQHFPDWFIRRLKKAAGRQMSKDGILIIKAQNYRSQARNKKTAFDRLVTLFTNAAKRPKPRKKSKVPKRAIESRLKNKKIRSQKKQLRKSPDRDDE
jgi:ribosome-associated protein